MQRISENELTLLIQNCEILEYDLAKNPKVFLNQNQDVIKFFPIKNRFKHLFSSQCRRFERIANKLTQRGIHTITPKQHYHCPERLVELSIYPWLEGQSLRALAQENSNHLTRFAKFIAELHEKNIYFRGAHLGNILVNGDDFILIDFNNTKFGVSTRRRIKNLRYILNYGTDRDLFQNYGVEKFVIEYLRSAKIQNQEKFQKLVSGV